MEHLLCILLGHRWQLVGAWFSKVDRSMVARCVCSRCGDSSFKTVTIMHGSIYDPFP